MGVNVLANAVKVVVGSTGFEPSCMLYQQKKRINVVLKSHLDALQKSISNKESSDIESSMDGVACISFFDWLPRGISISRSPPISKNKTDKNSNNS